MTINCENLVKVYGDGAAAYHALRGLSFSLSEREMLAVTGPSGCGKSTFLKVLAGIIKKFNGTVEINGQPVMPHKQKIGFIPQNYGLLPWKNVYENICLGVKIKNKKNVIE